jgi:hypothetical protein
VKKAVLVFGVFALCVAPFALAEDYDALKREVKMNEGADEGDIHDQIETRLEDAARLNEEAESIELENKELEGKVMKAQRLHDFWKKLTGKDQALLKVQGIARHSIAPTINQFPDVHRFVKWEYPTPLTEALESFLDAKGILCGDVEASGSKDIIRTAYTRLEGLPGKQIAEISVLVSFPRPVPGAQAGYYHVKYLIRYKKSEKDKWGFKCPAEVGELSEKFVDEFVDGLREMGRTPE